MVVRGRDITLSCVSQGDVDAGRGLEPQMEGPGAFPTAMLNRKDPSAGQRPLNYHLTPPNQGFVPHSAGGRTFPQQYPVSRLPYRVGQPPQHPAMGQQTQLSPAYSGGNHNPAFFGGPAPSHRGVHSPTLDGSESVDDGAGSMRAPMGAHVAGHHPGLLQPGRVNNFGEEGPDGGLADGLGEWSSKRTSTASTASTASRTFV